ncbi:MAG: ABC transporter permease [Lachnospiraceae bacterium]|nr:ABC transporter permease [Lachnospiraceae bacterium]
MGKKASFFRKTSVQTIIASIICALLGILVGFVILLIMNPSHAAEGMGAILRNFFKYDQSSTTLLYYLGSTLVKAVPLILCSEAILFAYKAGLFNIGAAGQYTVGILASLYTSLALGLSWWVCVLAAVAAGALWGFISGFFKAVFNVNEVIAGIMMNWIGLYLTNIVLGGKKVMDQSTSKTYNILSTNPKALLPTFLSDLFGHNQYMTIALPITVIVAIIILVVLNKTTFGYELKATGHNKEAAKYAGMNATRNVILTLVISGGIAGFAASMFYLTGIEQYSISSSVPGMGFNGIAVAFLGGLHPIGAIVAGLFIEYLTMGGQYLDTNYFNPQVADLMVAIIIYLCGFVLFFRHLMNKGKTKALTNVNDESASDKKKDANDQEV